MGLVIKLVMGMGKIEWIIRVFKFVSIEKDENGVIIGGDEGGIFVDKGMV